MTTDPLEHRLRAERPVPRTAFHRSLRGYLIAQRPGAHRPARLLLSVTCYAAVGVALLLIALILAG